jgi:hypothetical protein
MTRSSRLIRVALTVATAAALAAAAAAPARAQNPPAAAPAPAGHLDSLRAFLPQMAQLMAPLASQMSVNMMDAMLTVLERPATAERLATFTRNYYEALVRRGFTREEALRIVIGRGVAGELGGR